MSRTAWALPLALVLLALGSRVQAQDRTRLADARALQEVMAEAIKRAEPAIACVLVSREEMHKVPPEDFDPNPALSAKRLDDPEHIPESYGSGVVIDERGLVLTNLHVVRDATAIYVRLPGGKGSYASIHAGDPRSDLAVLRLQNPRDLPLKALPFGDGGSVRKGDWVIALANPFAAGFLDGSPSASWGIVSNLRRRAPVDPTKETSYRTLHQFGTLLQTDARINVGCSGGALLNLEGELIGLTTSLAALTGTESPGGFAVPMDAGMRRIIDVLLRGEEVEYGFLGVSFMKGSPLQQGEGVQIQQVIPGSPAYQAGLRAGRTPDFIRSINGTRVHDPDDLFLALGTLLAGSTVRLEVAHTSTGPGQVVPVKLAKFYVPGKIIASHRPDAIGGLRVDYTSVLYLRPGGQQIYARGIPDGVMIREVQTGSAADAARLQEAKVIQRVNGHRVTSPDEFYREMRVAASPVELTLVSSDLREEKVKIDIR